MHIDRVSRPWRRLVFSAGVALCLAALVPLPASGDQPLAAAAAAVEPMVSDFDWVDATRDRAVPVRLYWPAQVAGDTVVPLVVFSHGIGGSRMGYSYLGKHFASHGIASLHLQHVGSDRQLWFGNPFGVVSRLWKAASEDEAIHRVRDLRFSLDALLDRSAYGERIDRTRIAAAGHSYGANTVMLAAGATLQRNGHSVEFRDPRIRAALLLSAPPFYGEAAQDRILGTLTLPSLHVTATEDVIRVPGYYSTPDDRLAVFDAAGSRVKRWPCSRRHLQRIFHRLARHARSVCNPRDQSATGN
jgi:pimeloyl-ACP methyl ester carboxylesterase